MWILALIAAAAAEPRSIDHSTKSETELVGCAATVLADIKGYEVQRQKTATGTDLQMRTRILGIAKTVATISVRDLGTSREMTIYATGKKNGGPRVFSSRARTCV